MQSPKKTGSASESPAAPMSARSSAALGSNPQGDPSWSPLTLRGHATSKVSHPGGDCNNNLGYAIGHSQWSGRRLSRRDSKGAPTWCGRRPPDGTVVRTAWGYFGATTWLRRSPVSPSTGN